MCRLMNGTPKRYVTHQVCCPSKITYFVQFISWKGVGCYHVTIILKKFFKAGLFKKTCWPENPVGLIFQAQTNSVHAFRSLSGRFDFLGPFRHRLEKKKRGPAMVQNNMCIIPELNTSSQIFSFSCTPLPLSLTLSLFNPSNLSTPSCLDQLTSQPSPCLPQEHH